MSSIDYDLKKIRAFALDVDGVLSPSTIPMSAEGEPMRMVNIKDGYAIQLAAKYGYNIAIITGGKGDGLRKRYEALGVKDIFMGCAKKLPVLEAWMAENDIEPEAVAYMGDDIPDLQALRHVGLPVAPYDACAEVRLTARYISPFSGGYGCVRDLIEQVMKAKGEWMSDAKAFGW